MNQSPVFLSNLFTCNSQPPARSPTATNQVEWTWTPTFYKNHKASPHQPSCAYMTLKMLTIGFQMVCYLIIYLQDQTRQSTWSNHLRVTQKQFKLNKSRTSRTQTSECLLPENFTRAQNVFTPSDQSKSRIQRCSGISLENPSEVLLAGSCTWMETQVNFIGLIECSWLKGLKQSHNGRSSWLSDCVSLEFRFLSVIWLSLGVCVRTHCTPTLHSRTLIELSRPGPTFHLSPMPNTMCGFVPGETLR